MTDITNQPDPIEVDIGCGYKRVIATSTTELANDNTMMSVKFIDTPKLTPRAVECVDRPGGAVIIVYGVVGFFGFVAGLLVGLAI